MKIHDVLTELQKIFYYLSEGNILSHNIHFKIILFISLSYNNQLILIQWFENWK